MAKIDIRNKKNERQEREKRAFKKAKINARFHIKRAFEKTKTNVRFSDHRN